jgi:dodecin
MDNPVYKKIELVGTSTIGVEDAVNNALARAAKTLRQLRWFEVKETRGSVADGKVDQWQVTIEAGFRLED